MEQVEDPSLELRLFIFLGVEKRVVLLLRGCGLDSQLAGQVTWLFPIASERTRLGGAIENFPALGMAVPSLQKTAPLVPLGTRLREPLRERAVCG